MNFDLVITKFLEYGGILSPVVIAMGWYILRLHTQLKETYINIQKIITEYSDKLTQINNLRIDDANKVTDRIISLHDRSNEVLYKINTSVSMNSQLLEDVVDTLSECGDSPAPDKRKRSKP